MAKYIDSIDFNPIIVYPKIIMLLMQKFYLKTSVNENINF